MSSNINKEETCEAANFENRPIIVNDSSFLKVHKSKEFWDELEKRADNFRKNCLHYSDVYFEIESKIEYLLSKGVTEEEIRSYIDKSFNKILSKNK